MAEKQLYITRPAEEDRIYAQLQKTAIDEFVRLSGEVWSDYNSHDPGVTLSDLLNYALTEIDYKLSFKLSEYLSYASRAIPAKELGLFSANEIYSSAPVTADDYKRLILSNFSVIENMYIKPNLRTGTYDFLLRISSSYLGINLLKDRVRKFYNKHRNLCEDVAEIKIQELKGLDFVAEFDIDIESDATDVLIDIFYQIRRYLSGSITLEQRHIAKDYPVDEWYDGTTDEVRVLIPSQRMSQIELYWQLSRVSGVKNIRSCFFELENGDVVSDFKDGYAVNFPPNLSLITIKVNGTKVDIDVAKFARRLEERYKGLGSERLRDWLQRQEKDNTKEKTPTERDILSDVEYKDFYDLHPLFSDLPNCYKREPSRAFREYVKLFEYVMEGGLSELDDFKRLLSLENVDTPRAELKECYLDFLERIYGIAPVTKIIRGFDIYTLDKSEYLSQRVNLLKELPYLIKNRQTAANMDSENRIPNIKRLISLMLGMNDEEKTPASNVLTTHNIILMDDLEKQGWVWDRLNAILIDESLFESKSATQIELDEPPENEREKMERYRELREELQILNSNFISGGLFRGGVRIENYRLVDNSSGEYLLLCWSSEDNNWINLGRSNNKVILRRMANSLCRYFVELNKECERLYVVEKRFLDASDPFTLYVLFTGWSARTYSQLFRNMCAEMVASLLPAHIKVELHWLSAAQMSIFEDGYFRGEVRVEL